MGTRKTKKKLWKLLPLARAIGVLSAVGIATTLVTFAAIQSTGNALTGNTIQTATAALQISTNSSSGPWTDSVPGFAFTGLVPGGLAQPQGGGGYGVFLKNTGTASQKLQVTVPSQPTTTGTVDLAKVSIVFTPTDPGSIQTIPLATLLAGTVALTNSTLAVNGVATYHIQAIMTADAVTGNGATITNLNITFSGTPV